MNPLQPPTAPQMDPIARFRALVAEEVAKSLIAMQEPMAAQDPEDLKRRALLKIQMDPLARQALTVTTSIIQNAATALTDARINELLQPGMRTMAMDGRMLEVETGADKITVTNLLDGAALNVTDGGFVVFIDARCAGSEALKRWQRLVSADTRLMVIPLQPPPGQTVRDVVSARRQEEAEGFAG